RKLSIVFAAPVLLAFSTPSRTVSTSPATTRMAFHDAMRSLWQEHVEWTRMYIISAAAGLPDKDATTQRLLQNQTDIGNAVAEYYGKSGGDKLTSLLRNHILIAADLVGAAKAGNSAAVDSLNKKWGMNADEISDCLH